MLIFRFQATTVTATEGQLLTIFEVTRYAKILTYVLHHLPFYSQPSESAATLGDNRDIFNILTEANADLRVQV